MPDITGPGVIVAVDQGTSSTKALAVDEHGVVVGSGSVVLGQQHPHPGWVQQDARAINDGVIEAIGLAVSGLDLGGTPRVTVALSSQRESAVIWSRLTGEPLGPMLGWQDRRTVDSAQRLEAAGFGERVRQITGLPIDPMFSALKFAWLLDEIDPDRSRSARGEIALGTVDSWLLYSLTGEHRIEAGNASRTQLLDLATLDWSDELLALFRIPRAALPRVAASDEPSQPIIGVPSLASGTRVTSVLGDSHAALYGHGARTPGAVKVTLGTGSSIMGLLAPGHTAGGGLVTTVAWATTAGTTTQADGSAATAVTATYAFEGNILSAGSTVVWVAQLLGITPTEVFALAQTATPDPSAGVDLVPAFAGLGAPWWDDRARAIITGFDLGTSRASVALSAVESIVLQIEDVLAAAEQGGPRFDTVLIDGGPAANDDLAQLLADLSQRRVERPTVSALSALGAAHLAGTATSVFSDADVLAFDRGSVVFKPRMPATDALARQARWHRAVNTARGTPSVSSTAASPLPQPSPSLSTLEKETTP